MPNIAYLDFYYEKTATVNNLYNGGAFTITAFYDNTTIYINRRSDFPEGGVFYYNISYDYGMSWTVLEVNEDEASWALDPINAGGNIIITGTNEGPCYINIGADKAFKASGNIMTLLNAEDPDSIEELPEGCFKELFNYAPISVASELILPITTLSDWCYGYMFRNCSLLVDPPLLPATTLGAASYCYMFKNCTSLVNPPNINATILDDTCCAYMFDGCTSLIVAPTLPATTLAPYCYDGMFNGCTALTVAPLLPATTLANYCYRDMFRGCTSLNTAPALPATTLANYCYAGMFRGCTSLLSAPILPAPTLVPHCYENMFNGCTSLNYIKVLGIDRANYDTENWVLNVAPSGIFVKDINGMYVPDQPNGIPIGWTVYNEGETIIYYYTISALVDPEGAGTVSGGGTVQRGTIVTLSATPIPGYLFEAWYSNGAQVSSNDTITFAVTEDKTYVAKFIVDPNTYYDVTLSQDPEIGAVLDGAGRYVENTEVTIEAPAMDGYLFVGWSFDDEIVTTSRTYTFTLTEDVEFTAIYNAVSPYYSKYLTIESLLQYSYNYIEIIFETPANTNYIGSIEYSVNGGTWTKKNLINGSNMLINDLNYGDYVSFRNAKYNPYDENSCIHFRFWEADVYGNVMSFLPAHFDADNSTDTFYNGINLETLSSGERFMKLFQYANSIHNASNLILPATTLSYRCYYCMFDGAFFDNISFTASIPELPATTLAEGCYEYMFASNSSIVTPPELPATTLTPYCYAGMFTDCYRMTTAPDLLATTMYDHCYSSMFSGCKALVTAPVLPAATLTDYCYQSMFYNCWALQNVTCLATDISAPCCTLTWMSQVSLTGTVGTFTKPASMTSWSRGDDGIPEGWTIQNAS